MTDAPQTKPEKSKAEAAAAPSPATDLLMAARDDYVNGRLAEAETKLRECTKLDPDHFEVQYSLGVLLSETNRLDESEAVLKPILDKLPSRMADVASNLGLIHEARGEYDEAIAMFDRAIDREFQNAQVHLNKGFCLLRMGRFEEGWKEHEWRWQTERFNPIKCLQPRWDGSQLDGTLLVHGEQGAGDMFQFIRYMPKIRERCGRVLLMLSQPLHPVFAGGDWADELLPPGNLPLDRFQAILPLMSAPASLGMGDDVLGGSVPYLQPEAREVGLGEPPVADCKLKVGISWAGSPTHQHDKYRSCALKDLAALFDVPNVAFYGLQIGDAAAQIKELGRDNVCDTSDLQKDFADTAAIIKQLDLVVSVDTAVLHLAGGMGVPVWGLLSQRADWRWLDDGDSSAWYPTMKLYRQNALNDWTELASRVAADLGQMASSR